MKRPTDQRMRLTAYLAGCAKTPFAEGSHDCALFAAGAVEAMTGRNMAADWRGRYTTIRGGIRVLRRAGHDDHIALAASLFPETSTPQLGDIAVMPTERGPALGIVQGPGQGVYLPGEFGLVVVPIKTALQFFEV